MDGYEVAATLKGEPQLGAMKVIAVTASAMVGDRESIVAAGFTMVISTSRSIRRPSSCRRAMAAAAQAAGRGPVSGS